VNRHSVPNATLAYPGKPENGGSNPRFYEFDDRVTRLVKWHPSVHGPKACYNELVASRLGQLIDAPILRGIVVYVPGDVIPADHKAFGAKGGFHFAVTRLIGENYVPARHYAEIENAAELPTAATLLAWLAVGDQETHNQYLQKETRDEHGKAKETKLFLLVDMGQMFGTCSWAAGSVETPPAAYALPGHIADKLTSEMLKPAVDQLRKVSDSEIRVCFADRPEEWSIADADANAGVARVIASRDKIDSIIRTGNPTIK
jgi:hypothetical protein